MVRKLSMLVAYAAATILRVVWRPFTSDGAERRARRVVVFFTTVSWQGKQEVDFV